MTGINWTTLIPGALMSVVTGVVTWWITRWRSRLDEKRKMKRQLLTDLVANRYDLKGDPFSRALNAATVVFDDSPNVRTSIRQFHQAVTSSTQDDDVQDALLDMIRMMFDDLDLPHSDLTDDFLLRPFNTRQASSQSASATSTD